MRTQECAQCAVQTACCHRSTHTACPSAERRALRAREGSCSPSKQARAPLTKRCSLRACSISSCLEIHPSPGDGILPSSAAGRAGSLQPKQNRGRPVSRPPCYCASDQARRQSKLLAPASDQRVVHAPERQRTCGRCARIAMAAGRAGAWPAPPRSPAATSSCLEAYQAALRCQAVRHLPLRGHPLSRHGECLNPTKAGRGALSRACNRCGDELEPNCTLRSSSIAPYYLTRWKY